MTWALFFFGCLRVLGIHCNALSYLGKEWSPTVRVAAAIIPGSDPERPQKVNQDAYFSNGKSYIGVMDGHGLKGHLVTEFLQKTFPKRLKQYLPVHQFEGEGSKPVADDQEYDDILDQQRVDIKNLAKFDDWPMIDEVAKSLADAFLAAHLDARIDPAIPTGRSGTTALISLLSLCEKGDRGLYVAGVGDSSAMLVDDTGSFQELLPKSTLQIESERRRIDSCKGSIVGSNVFFGPVGIAMTRALGDSVMLPAGVVPIPMVKRISLEETRNYCVCLGSDGVFDVQSIDTVAKIIHGSNILLESPSEEEGPDKLQRLAEKICNKAKLAWKGGLPIEPSMDDMTCALMLVHY